MSAVAGSEAKAMAGWAIADQAAAELVVGDQDVVMGGEGGGGLLEQRREGGEQGVTVARRVEQ